MPIGRAKSMGIREAFYMTFSYKETRLCLAIGLAMLIVKGYCAQVGAGRSSQDGRRRTVGIQQPGMASSSQRSAQDGQQSAANGQRSGMAIKHHSFLICFAPPPDFSRPTARFRSTHSLRRSYPQGKIEGCPIWLWIRRFHHFESCG